MLVLLVMAMTQLSAADDTFSSLLEGLRDALTLDLDQVWFYRFLLSLPVGAYVFGLLAGLGRETPETMRKHGASAETALPKLRVVPEAVWLAALGVFSVLYLAFFFVQGRYLFGAFTRTLPGKLYRRGIRPPGPSLNSAASWRSDLCPGCFCYVYKVQISR